MVEVPRRARRTGKPMPPYRAVLAVDAEKFSRTSSMNQRLLNNSIQDALETAFRDCGLAGLWENASFPQHTGDGYVVGVDPEHLALLINPLMGELQEVLADMQPILAYEDRTLSLRLRAAIGLGPLPDSGGEERGDGIGSAMTETHRILDSAPLRRALKAGNPDVTYLVAGLSSRVYEDAVLGGYVALNPALFQPADGSIPDKEFQAEVYVYTPRPSSVGRADSDAGDPARTVGGTGAETGAGAEDVEGGPGWVDEGRERPSKAIGTNSGVSVQADEISGGLKFGDQKGA
ncbi:hypothetical protein [Nocardiopsis chromatogenes]|uniref:hypothetical protein n=1 Tax=Nocardiopsis chromatogenes TaxID=280239 RepID=UPI00034AD95A|nr:hypothetical protein [Nocardiopsis chromatogenes]